MTTTQTTCNWQGASGKLYSYTIYSLNTQWNDVPGNYIFAKQVPGGWQPLYIGETQSFKTRIPNHEKWPCVRRYGVTHIHAHRNDGGTAARKAEETDLLARFDPPCNKE